jgi:hypothetical protein
MKRAIGFAHHGWKVHLPKDATVTWPVFRITNTARMGMPNLPKVG